MKDAMLDVETMGVGATPAIIQIAAQQFDINTGELGSSFNMYVDLNSSVEAGLTITPGTINFWMTNPTVTQEAREAVMAETADHGKAAGNSLGLVLEEFAKWCRENNVEYLHGNGAASDNVWIRSACEAIKVSYPEFSFRKDMCYRTLRTLALRTGWSGTVVFEGIEHDALDDVKYQIKTLRTILEYLNIKEVK